jgi:hypothetical protein
MSASSKPEFQLGGEIVLFADLVAAFKAGYARGGEPCVESYSGPIRIYCRRSAASCLPMPL